MARSPVYALPGEAIEVWSYGLLVPEKIGAPGSKYCARPESETCRTPFQQSNLILGEDCVTQLVDINAAFGRRGALIGVEIEVSLVFELVTDADKIACSGPMIGPCLKGVGLPVESTLIAKSRVRTDWVRPGHPGTSDWYRQTGTPADRNCPASADAAARWPWRGMRTAAADRGRSAPE